MLGLSTQGVPVRPTVDAWCATLAGFTGCAIAVNGFRVFTRSNPGVTPKEYSGLNGNATLLVDTGSILLNINGDAYYVASAWDESGPNVVDRDEFSGCSAAPATITLTRV